MVVNWLAATQVPLVGGVLLWAGALKLFGRSAPAAARRSALSRWVGEGRVVLAFRSVGAVELAVAVVVLATPGPTGAATALVWCAVLLGYLGYVRVAAPMSSCGCLGKRSGPVRSRSFARAGLLILASALAMLGARWWTAAFAGHLLPAAAVLVVEAGLVVVLSPELDAHWLLPLRHWRVVHSHPLAGEEFRIPVESSVQQLVRSDAYRSIGAHLRSDLLDSWDEGEWRILTYGLVADGRHATAVFAVPLLRYQPDEVRVVVVDEAVQTSVVAQVG